MSNAIKPIPISFYLTTPHRCPYLEDEFAQTLFLSPEIEANEHIYSQLIRQGFRRSGEHIYRPQCQACQACISVRIPVAKFAFSRSHKRCLKKCSHFSLSQRAGEFDQEHYQLYDRYISVRHSDGDMYPTSRRQYKEFLLSSWISVQYIDFRDPVTRKLIATSVFDDLGDGLSAIYTFFDPDYSRFSLGQYAILKLIQLVREFEKPFLYLGYWIKNSPKMAYKGNYRPLECFVNNNWVQLS